MKILFLHGWTSKPGGRKPILLSQRPRGFPSADIRTPLTLNPLGNTGNLVPPVPAGIQPDTDRSVVPINSSWSDAMPSQSEIRQQIADQIVDALSCGDVPPWRKPWTNDRNTGLPANALSGNRYRGVNPILAGNQPDETGIRIKMVGDVSPNPATW